MPVSLTASGPPDRPQVAPVALGAGNPGRFAATTIPLRSNAPKRRAATKWRGTGALWRRRSPAGRAGAHPCSTLYSVEQADEAALQRERPRGVRLGIDVEAEALLSTSGMQACNMTNLQNWRAGGIQHKRRLSAAIPVTLRNKSWRTAPAPRWPHLSGRCRKDLGESDVKCSKITESILKSFITDRPDAADKPYGFALLGSLRRAFPCAQLSEGAQRAVAWSRSQSLRRPTRRSRRRCWAAGDDVRAPQIDGRALVRIRARSRHDRPPDCAAQALSAVREILGIARNLSAPKPGGAAQAAKAAGAAGVPPSAVDADTRTVVAVRRDDRSVRDNRAAPRQGHWGLALPCRTAAATASGCSGKGDMSVEMAASRVIYLLIDDFVY